MSGCGVAHDYQNYQRMVDRKSAREQQIVDENSDKYCSEMLEVLSQNDTGYAHGAHTNLVAAIEENPSSATSIFAAWKRDIRDEFLEQLIEEDDE